QRAEQAKDERAGGARGGHPRDAASVLVILELDEEPACARWTREEGASPLESSAFDPLVGILDPGHRDAALRGVGDPRAPTVDLAPGVVGRAEAQGAVVAVGIGEQGPYELAGGRKAPLYSHATRFGRAWRHPWMVAHRPRERMLISLTSAAAKQANPGEHEQQRRW